MGTNVLTRTKEDVIDMLTKMENESHRFMLSSMCPLNQEDQAELFDLCVALTHLKHKLAGTTEPGIETEISL